MEKVEWKKDVPVVGNYDVVVCGGGPAGFIAAVAGAREDPRLHVARVRGTRVVRQRRRAGDDRHRLRRKSRNCALSRRHTWRKEPRA